MGKRNTIIGKENQTDVDQPREVLLLTGERPKRREKILMTSQRSRERNKGEAKGERGQNKKNHKQKQRVAHVN